MNKKQKLGQDDHSINEHYKEPEYKWKIMNFDHLPKETSHDIKTALEKEHKALLASNNDLVDKRLLFEKENNDIRVFL